jgi:hypothetical protein
MSVDSSSGAINIISPEQLVEAAANKIKSDLNSNKEKLMSMIPDLISTLNSSIDVYDNFMIQLNDIRDDDRMIWGEKLSKLGAFGYNYEKFKDKIFVKLNVFQNSYKSILDEYNSEAFENINRLNPQVNSGKKKPVSIGNTPAKAASGSKNQERKKLEKIDITPRKITEEKLLNKKRKNTSCNEIIEFIEKHYSTKPDRPLDSIISPLDSEFETCAFCEGKSNDLEMLKKLGPIYGPFDEEGKYLFTHEKCALYFNEIFLDDNNRLKQVEKGAEKAKDSKCSVCNKKGAGLKCHIKTCKKPFHYSCALDEECLMDNQKYVTYCKKHSSGRVFNVDPDDYCVACYSKMDSDLIVKCTKCSISYHVYCYEPKLTEKPVDSWECSKCAPINLID